MTAFRPLGLSLALASLTSLLPAAELPLPAPPPPPRWNEDLHPKHPLSSLATPPGNAEELAAGELGETITERYPNRAVKIRRTVRQDEERNYVNHGPWTMYDPQGQVVAQGNYLDGQRHGTWMRVLPHFPAVEPDFQAPFHSQAEFQHGQLHGTWTVIDRQQRVVGTWQFEEGALHGEATIWYPNGQQRQMMAFREGRPDGEAIAWRQDGRVWGREFYRDGKQLIPVVEWYDRQQKKSEGWMLRSNFVIHADIQWWDGIIEITREETVGEDVRIGEWTEWHENGTVHFTGTFDRGKPVGEHTWWHENGQKQLAGVYESGLREGRWTGWHQNGQKEEEGEYLAGIKDGTWTIWNVDGQIAEVQKLHAGDEVAPLEDSEPYSHVSLDGEPHVD